MIDKYFQWLYEIEAVDAFALVDNMNHIVDGWTNSKYDSTIFTEIADSYLQIFGINGKSGFDIGEIVLSFERGLIFVRNYSRFLLLVIASPHADVSYLRLAVNVSIAELEESKKIQKIFKKLPPEKPFEFEDSHLDDNERSMINRIMENRDAIGRTD